MYNMQITIPIVNYKIDLEILIIIAIIYLITVVHTVCGCCNFYKLIEGMDTKKMGALRNNDGSSRTREKPRSSEGFTSNRTSLGDASPYDINNNTPINTSNWMQPNLTVTPGQPIDPAVQAILDRPEQPVPLPEGEMLMFANTPFKPECCSGGGSSFSNSSGCACMTVQQLNGLVTRWGNNVPYSEY